MKKTTTLLTALAIAVPFSATALPKIKIAWDPNPESDMHSYKVFVDNNHVATVEHSQTPTYIYDVTREGTFVFYLTAVDTSGNESIPSDSLSVTIDVPPGSPGGCKAEIIP